MIDPILMFFARYVQGGILNWCTSNPLVFLTVLVPISSMILWICFLTLKHRDMRIPIRRIKRRRGLVEEELLVDNLEVPLSDEELKDNERKEKEDRFNELCGVIQEVGKEYHFREDANDVTIVKQSYRELSKLSKELGKPIPGHISHIKSGTSYAK